MDDPIDNASVIEQCAHCSSNMDVSALRPFSNAVCPNCGEATRVLKQMGGYTISEKIGIGGMSVVYRARDAILGRDVALKVLNESCSAQPERIAKFEDEARIMAKVQNEHMVKIYSVGKEWGAFYIAMELIDGSDLETFVKGSGPIIEPQVLEIALQIVDGLQAAWKVGMLHRDIKPANILLDSSGVAKIVDFGLSLLNTQAAQAAEVWATPFYAPPETLLQQPEDFRSDMYALGCSLFQLLVGRPPFEEIPQSITALLEVKKKLPRLQAVAPDISPATCRIVNRLMEFSPGKRYASYEELKLDIQCAFNQLQTHREDWAERRRTLIRQAGRAKVRNIGLASLGGVLIVSLVVFLIMREPPPPPSHVVETPAATEVPVRPSADQVHDIGGMYRNAQEALEKGELEVAKQYFSKILDIPSCPLSTCTWASLQSALCSFTLGNYQDAADAVRRMHEKLKSEDPAAMNGTMKELAGLIHYMNGKADSADSFEGAPSGTVNVYLLVADSFKQWVDLKYRAVLDRTDELRKIADDAEHMGSARIAGIWLKYLSPFIQDAQLLDNIARLPEESEADLDLKGKAIDANEHNGTAPGSQFRQVLKSFKLALNVSREELKAKIQAARNLGEGQAEQAAPPSGQPVPPSFDDFFNQEMAAFWETWDFDTLREHFRIEAEKTGNDNNRVLLDTIIEMSGIADAWVDQLGDEMAKLPAASRTVTLMNGNRVTANGIRDGKLLLGSHPQGLKQVDLPLLGAENLIRIHRECAGKAGSNPDAVKKRHIGAVVFLQLIGQSEQAKLAANVIIANDADFAQDWKRWTMVLDAN